MESISRGRRFSASSPVAGGLSTFADVNTTGHQLVFDDHPDCQSIRIRTSAGSQIYFNDSCNEPYIYVSTAKGNVWIELSDEGTVNIYGKGSASFHFEEDINLTAGRNINIEARGNMNVNVKGDYIQNVDGGSDTTVALASRLSAADFDVKTLGAVNIQALTKLSLLSSNEMVQQSGGNFAITSGGVYREEAPAGIFMNSGAGSPGVEASDPAIFDLIQVPRIPTPEEIAICREPEVDLEALATTVPQHQPWTGRCGNTRGFRAFADESEASVNMRGSSRSDSDKPLLVIGLVNGVQAVFVPNSYQTSSLAEEPSFAQQPIPAGALNPASTYTTSQRMINFIQRFEALSLKAYLDAGVKFAIGFGHNIIEGDTITGDKFQGVVDKAELKRLRRTQGDLRIDENEANRIFILDLQKFEKGVKDNITEDITQNQFDAMVSFAYNCGIEALRKSTWRNELNNGRFQNVPNSWMKFVNSNNPKPPPPKAVNTGLVARRRDELEQFFALA
jgi:lysozyme